MCGGLGRFFVGVGVAVPVGVMVAVIVLVGVGVGQTLDGVEQAPGLFRQATNLHIPGAQTPSAARCQVPSGSGMASDCGKVP